MKYILAILILVTNQWKQQAEHRHIYPFGGASPGDPRQLLGEGETETARPGDTRCDSARPVATCHPSASLASGPSRFQ